MKKIIVGIFIGFALFYINFYPYESEIAHEISPNGKYKLIYKAIRYGGIFPGYYRHYIEVRKVLNDEYMFLRFIKSDDIKSPRNDAHWDGDTIVVRTGAENHLLDEPYKTVTTLGKTTFYFASGFAAK